MPPHPPEVTLACVILTAGGRERELERAVGSVLAQGGPPIEVVVVGNGVSVSGLPEGVDVLELAYNAGIPGGRNIGVQHTDAEVVLFLDDDGWLQSTRTAEHVRRAFGGEPRLGIVSFRIVDPASGGTQRRHVPRLWVGDPERSSRATTFLGGACAVRHAVFDDVGPLPGDFFYAHEETDFGWRALDAGWSIHYDAAVVMCHPATSPGRHAAYLRLNARNRVWLVRRRLPVVLAALHLVVWTVLTVLRLRRVAALRVWFGGLLEGLREPCGERRPIRWRTVARMTLLGRPPVV